MISLCIGGVRHTIGKLWMRATTLLETSPQSKVCTQSYGPLMSWESQFREFRDSNLGVPGQNDIWVLASWPCTIQNVPLGVNWLVNAKSHLIWHVGNSSSIVFPNPSTQTWEIATQGIFKESLQCSSLCGEGHWIISILPIDKKPMMFSNDALNMTQLQVPMTCLGT